MTSTTAPDALWAPPARIRGTLALIVGRDENAAVYERFGRRLSADGYAVGVFTTGAPDAVSWLAAEHAPRVLVGSDSGAGATLSVLTQSDAADGAIIAGALTDATNPAPDDAQRTACPLHLGVLAAQRDVSASAPTQPTAELPAAADLAAISVPVLAVHGGADPVSPFAQTVRALTAVPDIEILETVDGLHDAFNDASHRSVAAAIVLWLERLRTGDVHAPIIRAAGQATTGQGVA